MDTKAIIDSCRLGNTTLTIHPEKYSALPEQYRQGKFAEEKNRDGISGLARLCQWENS